MRGGRRSAAALVPLLTHSPYPPIAACLHLAASLRLLLLPWYSNLSIPPSPFFCPPPSPRVPTAKAIDMHLDISLPPPTPHPPPSYEGAKAIDMHLDISPQQMQALVYDACDANGMAEASGRRGRRVEGDW